MFVTNNRYDFTTIGSPIGLEYRNVLIEGADISYNMAIKIEPTLDVINKELYEFLNLTPINLKNSKFVVFKVDDTTKVFSLDWIIPSSVEAVTVVQEASFIVPEISIEEALKLKEIIIKLGHTKVELKY